MVDVYNKLAPGWPGIDKPEKIEGEIVGIYSLLGSDRELAEAQGALDRIRPPDSMPERLAPWGRAKGSGD